MTSESGFGLEPRNLPAMRGTIVAVGDGRYVLRLDDRFCIECGEELVESP